MPLLNPILFTQKAGGYIFKELCRIDFFKQNVRQCLPKYFKASANFILYSEVDLFTYVFLSLYKENLWKSTGVQQAYQRRNEFQLADSAEYFLKNVTKYTADNFVPSDQDVLRTRIQTTGVVKVKY